MAHCRQLHLKGRQSSATHHCGAAQGKGSRCCCPPQTRKSPASGTCRGLLRGERKEMGGWGGVAVSMHYFQITDERIYQSMLLNDKVCL